MTKALIAELLERKRWVIGAMLMAFLSCLIYFSVNVPMYRSTIEVYTKNAANELMDDSPLSKSPEHLTLLFHSATSTAMFDRLIDRFGLHRRFNVPDTSRAGRSELYALLADRVKAQITKMNSVEIAVQDEDRATAADMANTIHEGLLEIYTAEDEAELERMMRIYQVMIDSTDGLAARKSKELFDLATDITGLQKTSTLPAEARKGLMDLEQATSTEDLFQDRRKVRMLLAISKGNEASVIRLKKRANEDMELHPLLKIAELTAIITLGVGLVCVAIILIPLDQRLSMERVADVRE
jgi:hypothetical protein